MSEFDANTGESAESLDYAEQLRQASAAAYLHREVHLELAEKFTELHKLMPDPEIIEQRDMAVRSSRMLEELGASYAGQAIAYEDMMAAGGPENSRTYVEYEAMSQRLVDLLPKSLFE